MEKLICTVLLLLLASSVVVAASLSNHVPAIFVLGDSIFDAGNNHFNKNCTAQADFPPYGSSFFHRPTGRFTNGRTVVDFISSRDKCFKQIQAAIAKYREIKDNINEGLKFYVTLQDAITNVKQQCSDFTMTRNIQCREMIEDVQRQMACLSFQDRKNTGPYPPVGQTHQTPRNPPQPQTEPQNAPHPQTPYYRPSEQPMTGYGHPSSYGAPQQPPQHSYGHPPTTVEKKKGLSKN